VNEKLQVPPVGADRSQEPHRKDCSDKNEKMFPHAILWWNGYADRFVGGGAVNRAEIYKSVRAAAVAAEFAFQKEREQSSSTVILNM